MEPLFQRILDPRSRWQLWFWLLILGLAPVEAVLSGDFSLGEALIFRIIGLISKMIAAYALAYVLIPRLLFRRRYVVFLLGLIALVAIMPVVARALNIFVAEAWLFPDRPNETAIQIVIDYRLTFGLYFYRVFFVAFTFAFIKISVDQLRSQQRVAELEREKAAAELRLLKAQIHPHFLFNTLNNLYTLALERSERTAEVVLQLSNILDYLLYQGSKPRVPIGREVELLENYIGLERLRYGDRLRLEFRKRIADPDIAVAPLLLLAPVENAFKHGASGSADPPAIEIELAVDSEQLHLRVWNTRPDTPPTDEREYTAGIGLRNVRAQLTHLYPERHELTTRETATDYTVDLRIRL